MKQPQSSVPRGSAAKGVQEEVQLVLLRHGIAAERIGPYATDDSKRPLTPKGRKRTKEVAAGLKRLGFGFDWIVTSPLVRARETAEIVAAANSGNIPLDQCAALQPGGSVDEILSFLAENRSCQRVLLVGHEPDLSGLAARLIGAGGNANLVFRKGGCCLIQCETRPGPSSGHLVWWLTPKIFRTLLP